MRIEGTSGRSVRSLRQFIGDLRGSRRLLARYPESQLSVVDEKRMWPDFVARLDKLRAGSPKPSEPTH
jgi:hypothetical protein